MSATETPRVVIVSATPIDGEWATSDLMRTLFTDWPDDRLSQIVLRRAGVDQETQPIRTLALALDGTRNPMTLATEMRAAKDFCVETGATVLYFRSAGWPVTFEALPLWLKRQTGVRLVTHLMDDWPARLTRTRPGVAAVAHRLLTATLTASDDRLAISQPMADHYQTEVGLPFRVAHNGVETVATTRAAHLPNDPLRIGYSGGAAVDQSATAIDDAVRAVELLVERGLRVQLDLALSPRHVDEVRRRTANSSAVHVLDFVERPEHERRLRSADVLLMAFNFDPTSVELLRLSMANKVGDYLAARRPIVVYGPKELATVASARSLGWGHVVDQHGPHRLADGLAEVLGNAAVQRELMAGGAEAARAEFDLAVQRAALTGALRG